MQPPVPTITPREVQQWQQDGQAFSFLDIREIHEVTVSRLTEVHIPMAFCLSRQAGNSTVASRRGVLPRRCPFGSDRQCADDEIRVRQPLQLGGRHHRLVCCVFSRRRSGMKRHLGIFLRGMAMGAADLVPGVSGGTVALITGIYDDLLHSISAVSLGLVDTWKNEGFQGVLRALNAPFLVALVAGIGTSIIALSGFLHHLLEHHKAALFAFFFGLVAASIPMVGREITQRNATITALFIAGAAITFGVGSLPPLQVEPSLAYLFACGAIAACAMILPGISGSFILLLLGVYSAVIGALKELDYGHCHGGRRSRERAVGI